MGIYYNFKKIFNFKIPVILKKVFKKSYGRDNLDLKLEKYLNYSNGFFIELGAHDGITQSNTYYYEKKKNWKGILIEPVPKLYKYCKKYRSKKNLFFCNACVSFDFKNENVKLISTVTIPANSTLEVLTGGKIVMQATDVLQIDCSVADKVSGVLSVMEIT